MASPTAKDAPLSALPSESISTDSDPSIASDLSSNAPPQTPARMPYHRRSSCGSIGGALLVRLASRNSAKSKEEADPINITANGSETPGPQRRRSSQSSDPSNNRLSKLELAELGKPKGKFKSGVKWDEYNVPEPFMETSALTSTAAAETALKNGVNGNMMLTSSSTAAAKAYVESISLGQPILPARRGSASASGVECPRGNMYGLPSASQTLAAPSQSGLIAGILVDSKKSPSIQTPVPASETPASAASKSRDASPSSASGNQVKPDAAQISSQISNGSQPRPGDPKMVAEAAQKVLEAARKQARVEQTKNGRSVPASSQRSTSSSPKDFNPSGLSPLSSASTLTTTAATDSKPSHSKARDKGSEDKSEKNGTKDESSTRPAKSPRRKSLIGTIKEKSKKSLSRKHSISSGAVTPTGEFDSSEGAASPNGAASDAGTAGRRRRYVDTRDLDLLAYELAAEAIASGMPDPPFARTSRSGASSPRSMGRSYGGNFPNESRRRSYHSTGSGGELQFNASQTSLSNMMMQPMTQMTPMSRSREASFSNASSSPNYGTPGNSLHGSPPMRPMDTAMMDQSREPQQASSYAAQASNLVPHDMLTGLGDSPYPIIPRRSRDPLDGIDSLDPFGIPLSHKSPFDATSAYANRTNVYHSPTQVAHFRKRNGSSGSAGNGTRRSVLQMKMHDPESELQGLTKMPKGKRGTPFGSRASSRAVTPSASFTNLNDAAKIPQQSSVSAERDSHHGAASPSYGAGSEQPLKQKRGAVTETVELVSPLTVPSISLPPTLGSDVSIATPKAEHAPTSRDILPTFSSGTIKAKRKDDGPDAGATAEAWSSQAASSEGSKEPAVKPQAMSSRATKPESISASTLSVPSSKASKRLSSIFGLGRSKKEKALSVIENTPRSPTPSGRLTLAADLLSVDTALASKSSASRPASTRSTKAENDTQISPRIAGPDLSSVAVAATADTSDSPKDLSFSEAAVKRPEPSPQSTAGRDAPMASQVSPTTAAVDKPAIKPKFARSVSSLVQSKKDDAAPSVNGVQKSKKQAHDAGGHSNGGIRRFLRRLGSFGASSPPANDSAKAAKQNSAKANFPDALIMPKLDTDTLKKVGVSPTEVKVKPEGHSAQAVDVPKRDGSIVDQRRLGAAVAQTQASAPKDDVSTVTTRDGTSTFVTADGGAQVDLVPMAEKDPEQEMAHSQPDQQGPNGEHVQDDQSAAMDSETTKGGFGTRSAFIFSVPPQIQTDEQAKDGDQDHVDAAAGEGRLTGDSLGLTLLGRSDSHTPSSEDSAFYSNGSYVSGPDSGGLLMPGESEAIDEAEEGLTPASSSKSLVPPSKVAPVDIAPAPPIVGTI